MDKQAVDLFGMKIAHIGINAENKEEGSLWAGQFEALMGLPKTETPVSYFAGDLVEVMKENGRGTYGHIGFSVNNCEAAMKYFTDKGMNVVEQTKKFDTEGHIIFVYFKEEIGGFAIHLIQES